MLNKHARIVTATATLFLVTALSTGSSFAQTPKAGWGVEEQMQFQNQLQQKNLEFNNQLQSQIQNQIHIGPPGTSVRPEELHEQILVLNQQLRQSIQVYVTEVQTLIKNFVSSFWS